MKKAFKAPYIGTRAELKRESIRNLKELVAYLNWYKGRAVICKNMIIKLLGIYKSWNWLNKQGLIDILTAWKNLANRWTKSRNYKEQRIGSEVYIMRGSKVYKRYLPAQKLWEARAIASECTGLWTAIRKAKRCIGFKWEVEEWHPDSEEDLLSTVHKIFTHSGTFTKKESPDNPFCNTSSNEIPTSSDLEEAAAARDDLFGEETPPEKPIINPFKRSILDRVQEPKETSFDKQKFVEDSINEAYKAADLTGWEINSINRTMENADTSIAIVENKVIFNFKTGKTIKSVISCLPDKYEVFKISNTPGKGWFREHISGVIDTSRRFHKSLMRLIEIETSYVPF